MDAITALLIFIAVGYAVVGLSVVAAKYLLPDRQVRASDAKALLLYSLTLQTFGLLLSAAFIVLVVLTTGALWPNTLTLQLALGVIGAMVVLTCLASGAKSSLGILHTVRALRS